MAWYTPTNEGRRGAEAGTMAQVTTAEWSKALETALVISQRRLLEAGRSGDQREIEAWTRRFDKVERALIGACR